MHEADKKHYIMTSATSGTTDTENNSYGLPMSHAYSVISAHTIKDSSGKVTNRLLLVRNPWGVDHGYYNGPWNDKDTENWTAENKSQVPFSNANDGMFFIEDKDFV